MVTALHLQVAGLGMLELCRDDDGAGARGGETIVLSGALDIFHHLRVDIYLRSDHVLEEEVRCI
jgi:hypothetical protein